MKFFLFNLITLGLLLQNQVSYGSKIERNDQDHGKLKADQSGTFLVSDKEDGYIYFLSPEYLIERNRLKTEEPPHQIAISPSGREALVSHYGSFTNPGNSISLIDIENKKLIQTIRAQSRNINKNRRPHGIVFLDNKEALVTMKNSEYLYSFNRDNLTLTPSIFLNGEEGAKMIILGPKGYSAYVSNSETGSVFKIDLMTRRVSVHINIGKSAEGMDITSDGKILVVTNPKQNYVSLIETRTMTERKRVSTSRKPTRVAIFGENQYAAVTTSRSGKLDIIHLKDRATKAYSSYSPLGELRGHTLFPSPIAVFKKNNFKLLIANSSAGSISEIDTSTDSVTRVVKVGSSLEDIAYSTINVTRDESLEFIS